MEKASSNLAWHPRGVPETRFLRQGSTQERTVAMCGRSQLNYRALVPYWQHVHRCSRGFLAGIGGSTVLVCVVEAVEGVEDVERPSRDALLMNVESNWWATPGNPPHFPRPPRCIPTWSKQRTRQGWPQILQNTTRLHPPAAQATHATYPSAPSTPSSTSPSSCIQLHPPLTLSSIPV